MENASDTYPLHTTKPLSRFISIMHVSTHYKIILRPYLKDMCML